MKTKKGFIPMLFGLLLIAAALVLTGANLIEDHAAAVSSQSALTQLAERIPTEPTEQNTNAPAATLPQTALPEQPDYVRNPEMEMPVETIDGEDYIGILQIPAVELSLPVISRWSYARLELAPCRYSGSAYSHDMVIAAHNYTAHFAVLKELQEGDTVVFVDVNGNVFTYQVALSEILNPTETEEMTSGDWDLTLFTCTYGGQSRVTVRCELISK